MELNEQYNYNIIIEETSYQVQTDYLSIVSSGKNGNELRINMLSLVFSEIDETINDFNQYKDKTKLSNSIIKVFTKKNMMILNIPLKDKSSLKVIYKQPLIDMFNKSINGEVGKWI